MTSRSLSFPAVAVLHALAAGVPYGFQILDRTGLPSGTVYPILSRFERDGLVRSSWEEARAARDEKRPRRRYYRLTAEGERALDEALRQYRALESVRRRSQAHALPGRARG